MQNNNYGPRADMILRLGFLCRGNYRYRPYHEFSQMVDRLAQFWSAVASMNGRYPETGF